MLICYAAVENWYGPSLSLAIFLILKFAFSGIYRVTPDFVWLCLHIIYISFHSFILVGFFIYQVFLVIIILLVFFFIHSDNLCLIILYFHSFTFNLITYMVWLMSTILPFYLFHLSFLYFSFLLLYLWVYFIFYFVSSIALLVVSLYFSVILCLIISIFNLSHYTSKEYYI